MAVLIIVLVDVVLTLPAVVLAIVNEDVDLVLSSSEVNVSLINTCPNINIHSSQDQGVQVENYTYICIVTIYYAIYVAIVILYKLVLHVIALVLAWLTRKVEIDALNDYKSTVATIVCSSILLLLLCITLPVPIFNTSAINRTLWPVLASLVILAHLGLTFIPKVSLHTI